MRSIESVTQLKMTNSYVRCWECLLDGECAILCVHMRKRITRASRHFTFTIRIISTRIVHAATTFVYYIIHQISLLQCCVIQFHTHHTFTMIIERFNIGLLWSILIGLSTLLLHLRCSHVKNPCLRWRTNILQYLWRSPYRSHGAHCSVKSCTNMVFFSYFVCVHAIRIG